MYKCKFFLCQQVLSVWILSTGFVWGRPFLEPSSVTSCPEGFAQLFTCHDSFIDAIEWIVEPENCSIRFTLNNTINTCSNRFSAQLFNSSGPANMTTNINVTTAGLKNGTQIICRTSRGMQHYNSSSTFHFADVPYHKNAAITYNPSENYFTATLQLRDMFEGGGVPIDNYTIQVEENAEFQTSDPTYAFDIPYNKTLTVDITAHNCAGNSDPLTLVLKYKQVLEQSSAGGSFPIVIPIAIGSAVTAIIIVLLVVLCLCKIYRRYTRTRTYNMNTGAVFSQRPQCTAHNPAIVAEYTDPYSIDPTGLTIERPTSHYNMENNPVYITTFKGEPDAEKTRKSIHLYDTIEILLK